MQIAPAHGTHEIQGFPGRREEVALDGADGFQQDLQAGLRREVADVADGLAELRHRLRLVFAGQQIARCGRADAEIAEAEQRAPFQHGTAEIADGLAGIAGAVQPQCAGAEAVQADPLQRAALQHLPGVRKLRLAPGGEISACKRDRRVAAADKLLIVRQWDAGANFHPALLLTALRSDHRRRREPGR